MRCQGGGEKKAVFGRFKVTKSQECVFFAPTALTDNQIVEPMIKRAMLGAVFLEHMSKLPKEHGRVLWEVDVSSVPPAKIRPLKPKMWLVVNAVIKKGLYYQLK